MYALYIPANPSPSVQTRQPLPVRAGARFGQWTCVCVCSVVLLPERRVVGRAAPFWWRSSGPVGERIAIDRRTCRFRAPRSAATRNTETACGWYSARGNTSNSLRPSALPCGGHTHPAAGPDRAHTQHPRSTIPLIASGKKARAGQARVGDVGKVGHGPRPLVREEAPVSIETHQAPIPVVQLGLVNTDGTTPQADTRGEGNDVRPSIRRQPPLTGTVSGSPEQCPWRTEHPGHWV